MHLCIFNPEHDLCLAKGRAHYVPPRSAIEFARRDSNIMSVLYPDALCTSVYDMAEILSSSQQPLTTVTAWGWNNVIKHELMKRGVASYLLPSDEYISTIRELQHRSTILPLQPDCHAIYDEVQIETLLTERDHWVMKAPWSGAGRGLRWVHGSLTSIDRNWLRKTIATQHCVIAEPRRDVMANVALEYNGGIFGGYSYFKTGVGVYKENVAWDDKKIENTFPLCEARQMVESWLEKNIWPRYHGPLGVDLMVSTQGEVFVAEMNLRHTMGMVAHERLKVKC